MPADDLVRNPLGRPRRVEDDAFFEATARAWARFGYAGLTLAAIASEVGLTPGAIVQRFGSKRGLLLSFYDAANALTVRQFLLATEANRSPLAALWRATVGWAIVAPDAKSQANLMSVFTELAADDDLGARSRNRLRIIHQHTQRLLDAAVQRGELSACDTAELSRVLVASVLGALLRWAVTAEGPVMERIKECFNSAIRPLKVGSASRRHTPQPSPAGQPAARAS